MRWMRPLLCVSAVMILCVAGFAANGGGKKKTNGTSTSAPTSQPAGKARGKKAASAKSKPKAPPQIAYIRMAGAVPESPPDFELFGTTTETTLQEWLQRLAKARNDDKVDAVALEIDDLEVSWAQAQELSDAVERLNAAKPVYAYVNSPGPCQHLIAAAAREVAMDGADEMEIIGVGAEMLFFRGTLDKLGIEPQMVQVGRFKGASEPMMLTEPSKEVIEVYNWVLDDLYDQLVGQIERLRKIKTQDVKDAIDEGPISAVEAKKRHFVDELIEKSDWEDHVADAVAGKDGEYVWLDAYGKKAARSLDSLNPLALLGTLLKGSADEPIEENTIAIINADGVITGGASGQTSMGEQLVGSRTLADCFDLCADEPKIKAVIFRINSPGGSALASEQIYQAVKRCAEVKPVIASVSEMAASGGYYVALGAPTIYADSSSITGSIGVVCGKMAFTGLMDKIGVSRYEITRGKNAGLNMLRPWNEREMAVVKKLAEHTYDLFTSRVRESRGDKIKQLDEVAQGRIFTARQAVAKGLVDKIGGLREAVLGAQEAADIHESHFLILPRPRKLMDVLLGDDDASARMFLPAGVTEGLVSMIAQDKASRGGIAYLLSVAKLMSKENVLTAMPTYFSIKR